jgi:class 3 adenylate cyclase
MRAAGRQLKGERKPVTILFSDIVGSTAMAEKLDPEEWKEVVAGAHRQVSEAVYRYEGTIAQLLGDGVLAFFGAPLTHEDDPERAVRAALDIQTAMAVYRAELEGYVDDFQVRIGLHTGEVVVGQIGDDLHMEYLALGDAVNLAARLQGAAQPGGVLISETTALLVRGRFDLVAFGEIDLKGKAAAVSVYSVSRLKKVPEAARGLPGLSTQYVGRDQELSLVTACLEKLIEGFGGLVFILGEAGIGKTRLVEETRRLMENPESHTRSPRVRSGSAIRWLEGRALSYGANLSYWPIIQLLQVDLGLTEGDPAPKVRAAIRRRLKELFGEGTSQIEPYLAHLMGISLEGPAADQIQILDGEALKWQTHQALSDYFKHVADEAPTVLIFEDLHWADPSTLELLEVLVALSDRAPLLIVVLMRVDREHKSWQLRITVESQFPHRYNEINLQQLSKDMALKLMTGLLTTAELPSQLREQMLIRAEGNPLFLGRNCPEFDRPGSIGSGRWSLADQQRNRRN